MKTALSYLRVSTAAQADTDERDPDGYSIPAQREACERKAVALGATIEEVFVDRGESARQADRRGLQRLLERVRQGGVDYVIVHKVDRLARNRADDIAIVLALRAGNVQLVSCTENIDETPSGKLLHGIMASIAEFYSSNLATEVTKGMAQKAKAGGTPSLAPLGYLNVRQISDGREVRTVVVDPERADLMRYAFEAYATGDYSLQRLLDELTEMGLRSRPTPKRPASPLGLSQFNALLRNPYYIGVVTYCGDQYPGRHEPLIDGQLFQQVQALLDAHRLGGERSWLHHHYLKGTLYCHRCHSRLSLTMAKGNGGIYPYFYCLGRATKRTKCDLRWLSVDRVETAVETYFRERVQLPEEVIEQVRTGLQADLALIDSVGESEIERQRKILSEIEKRRREVALKTENGSIPDDIGRERQNALAVELAGARSYLAKLESSIISVEDNLNVALDLVQDCGRAYAAAGPALRRHWNQALFERIEVDEDRVEAAELAPPFDILLNPEVTAHYQRASGPIWDETALTAALNAQNGQNETRPLVGAGLNVDVLVVPTGFEPALPP